MVVESVLDNMSRKLYTDENLWGEVGNKAEIYYCFTAALRSLDFTWQ